MKAATQIAYSDFDRDYFTLPASTRQKIDGKIDEMGTRLAEFPHYRLRGSLNCRLRVGDYRIIYRIDIAKNEIHLLAVGNRREIYR